MLFNLGICIKHLVLPPERNVLNSKLVCVYGNEAYSPFLYNMALKMFLPYKKQVELQDLFKQI